MTPPNILIFMSDQEQAKLLDPTHPCHTPHAARLASEGITFRSAYCPAPHCCPSRATFMTGMYPSRHGVFNNVSNPAAISRGLTDGVHTFSEQLQTAGYRLAFSGKWHVTDEENPADRGWQELFTTAGKGSYMHAGLESYRSMERNDQPRQYGQIKRPGWGDIQLFDAYKSGGEKGYEDHKDYRVARAACEALPELAASDRPWVLFVGTIGPHDPFVVPQRFLDLYRIEDIPLPPNFGDAMRDKPAVYQRMRDQYWGQLSETEVKDAIRHYWAYCSMIDAMFGEVLETLEKTGQAENTLVLRTSDHGEYAGAHGLFFKGVPAFREGYHIPAIVRYPAKISAPGGSVDAFVSLADFAPTFLELAGLTPPNNLSGSSLIPFLSGITPTDWRDAHYTQLNGVELYYSQRSVQTQRHKYVYNGFDFDELYDLDKDPHELKNVAADPAYAEIKRHLVKKMWRFAAAEGDERLFNPYGTVALAPWGPGEAL
ncbi:MAG: sulfatase-like hydrolase/transferase [Chloroflexota bacterium]